MQPSTRFVLYALWTLISALVFIGCALKPCGPSARVFDVRQFGAKGDAKSLDTPAVQQALDECAKAGGGIVRLPPGTYLSRPIFLHSNSTLQIDAGATLLATDEPGDFQRPEKQSAAASSASFFAFVNGKDLTNVAITGKGTIDGAGARWWVPAEEARRKTPNYTLPRPRLVLLSGCKNVRVAGVTLANSPTFHLVPTDCEDVVIENVTITAPAHSPNTDGIDPSVSRRVRISKCRIDVGDDNIAIKSGKKIPGREFACEDITISDCVFLRGHGVSIGSETAGGVRNVTVRRCSFQDTENGLRIKSPRGRGGRVENVSYSDITMKNVDPAITITCYYPKIPVQDAAMPLTDETPMFHNIHVKNVQATCLRNAGLIVGLPESLVTGVVLENVRISSATNGLTIRNAKAVQLKNVQITPSQGRAFIVNDAQVEGLEQ